VDNRAAYLETKIMKLTALQPLDYIFAP
jgi:hypothetical protein